MNLRQVMVMGRGKSLIITASLVARLSKRKTWAMMTALSNNLFIGSLSIKRGAPLWKSN